MHCSVGVKGSWTSFLISCCLSFLCLKNGDNRFYLRELLRESNKIRCVEWVPHSTYVSGTSKPSINVTAYYNSGVKGMRVMMEIHLKVVKGMRIKVSGSEAGLCSEFFLAISPS